jgi:hypothetical protein
VKCRARKRRKKRTSDLTSRLNERICPTWYDMYMPHFTSFHLICRHFFNHYQIWVQNTPERILSSYNLPTITFWTCSQLKNAQKSPPSQNISISCFVLSQTIFGLTKLIENNTSIYDIKLILWGSITKYMFILHSILPRCSICWYYSI